MSVLKLVKLHSLFCHIFHSCNFTTILHTVLRVTVSFMGALSVFNTYTKYCNIRRKHGTTYTSLKNMLACMHASVFLKKKAA